MKKKYYSLLLVLLFIPLQLFCQTQIGEDIDGLSFMNSSGSSVSLSADGNIVAIGGPRNNNFNGSDSGYVRIYENNSGTWSQIGQDIYGESLDDSFGDSVFLSSDGNILAVGATRNDVNGLNAGHVRVYENISNVWVQMGNDIDGDFEGDFSGSVISLSSQGNILAISSSLNDSNGLEAGQVRVFENIGGIWTKIGNDILGSNIEDRLGIGMSLSANGNFIAVGAPGSTLNGDNEGYVRVFENIGGIWSQIGNDIVGNIGDTLGARVLLSSDGNKVVIAANQHIEVHENINSTWVQVGNNIDLDIVSFQLGVSISSDANIIALGDLGADSNGSNSGQVKVYKIISGVWTQVGQNINGEAQFDNSGEKISLSSDGNVIAIGAKNNDGNGPGSGHVRIYDLSQILSIDELDVSTFRVFPNPVLNKLTVTLKNNLEINKVDIFNSFGQLILTTSSNVIDVGGLSKGVYFVKITSNKGPFLQKIIKL
jgi:hypothetical protein